MPVPAWLWAGTDSGRSTSPTGRAGLHEVHTGHVLPGRDPKYEKVPGGLAEGVGEGVAAGAGGGGRGRAGERHADGLGDRRHRVGGEHPGTRPLAGAGGPLDVVEV